MLPRNSITAIVSKKAGSRSTLSAANHPTWRQAATTWPQQVELVQEARLSHQPRPPPSPERNALLCARTAAWSVEQCRSTLYLWLRQVFQQILITVQLHSSVSQTFNKKEHLQRHERTRQSNFPCFGLHLRFLSGRHAMSEVMTAEPGRWETERRHRRPKPRIQLPY